MNVIYLRTSTDKQAKGLDAQKRSIIDYCKKQGISEAELKVYEDFAFSGANKKRPALEQLINDVKNGEVTNVYIYSVSRLSRSLRDLFRYIGCI